MSMNNRSGILDRLHEIEKQFGQLWRLSESRRRHESRKLIEEYDELSRQIERHLQVAERPEKAHLTGT
jgi:hypothetical protein